MHDDDDVSSGACDISLLSEDCRLFLNIFAFITDGRFLTHRSALFILLVVVVISCNCNEHKICTNIYIDESTPDIVIVVCCVISYHYECMILVSIWCTSVFIAC